MRIHLVSTTCMLSSSWFRKSPVDLLRDGSKECLLRFLNIVFRMHKVLAKQPLGRHCCKMFNVLSYLTTPLTHSSKDPTAGLFVFFSR